MFFEGPDVIQAGRLRETAKVIADWVLRPQRLERGPWVVGVYGPRGSGKTSLLLTVLDELRQRRDNSGRDDIRLPKFNEKSGSFPTTQLFGPADTRDHDDLYFLLLDHLENLYGIKNDQYNDLKDTFKEARELEVRRRDFDRVIEYEQEVSTSRKRMVENLVELRKKTATTTRDLTKAFKKICALYTGKAIDEKTNETIAKRPFLLLVDDLDLKPDRAFELLELLRLFFAHPGAVVLIAADPDLLAEAVNLSLKKSELNPPGLAHALIAKLIPYRWHVPSPSDRKRFDRLWNGVVRTRSSEAVKSELRFWWNDRASVTLFNLAVDRGVNSKVEALREQSDTDHEINRYEIRRKSEEEAKSQYGTLELAAKTSFAPFLPSTYRGLNSFHNLLVALHEQFWTEEKHERADIDDRRKSDALHPISYRTETKRFFIDHGLPDELVYPFLSVVASVDTEFGELGLLHEILERPGDVLEAFDALLYPSDGSEQMQAGIGYTEKIKAMEQGVVNFSPSYVVRISGTKEESENLIGLHGIGDISDSPLKDRLRPPWFSGRRLGRVKRVLRELAGMWDWWKQSALGAERVENFLAVSLNTDAMVRAEELWSGLFAEEEVLHLDLRKFCGEDRSSPEELLKARERAKEFIKARNIREMTGKTELLARTQLPLACWLGWYLRHMRLVTAYNDFAGRFTPYVGPSEPLQYEDRGRYTLLEPEKTESSRRSWEHAILLIDLLGKSVPEQLKQFYPTKSGESLDSETALAVRMIPKRKGWRLNPEDLQIALEDVYECISGLRHRNEVQEFHIGLACPDVFAFFLGRELNALGDIHLYEYYDDPERKGYRHVFQLAE